MKNFYFVYLFLLISSTSSAQFSIDSVHTDALCNAFGTQLTVKALSDDNYGYSVFWLDKRNGTQGTSIYMQNTDSSGVPLLDSNGQLTETTIGREIWGYDVKPWQTGYLLAWVQGGFGIGGDTLFCDYISKTGQHNWSQPLLLSFRNSNFIYVSENGLCILPNDSGVTITYGLSVSGGADVFVMNRIDFNGNIRWPINSVYFNFSSYNHVVSDNHNGYFVASTGGGLGGPISVSHFKMDGTSYFSPALNISQTAGGRNNSWKILCDTDTNAYVVWDNNIPGDLVMTKVNSSGQFAWPSGYITLSGVSGFQTYGDFIFTGSEFYVTWADGRPPASNFYIGIQKVDLNGTMLWTPDGNLISTLPSYIPYPKVILRTDGSIADAFSVNSTFRMQSLESDSTTDWATDGLAVATTTPPFYDDFVLVTDPSGAVASFWSNGQDVYGARMSRDGFLTKINTIEDNSFSLYPNPAKDILKISPAKNSGQVTVKIFNLQGQEVFSRSYNSLRSQVAIDVPVNGLAKGIYAVNIFSGALQYMKKVVIE